MNYCYREGVLISMENIEKDNNLGISFGFIKNLRIFYIIVIDDIRRFCLLMERNWYLVFCISVEYFDLVILFINCL